jgi:hypothetical protein
MKPLENVVRGKALSGLQQTFKGVGAYWRMWAVVCVHVRAAVDITRVLVSLFTLAWWLACLLLEGWWGSWLTCRWAAGWHETGNSG